MMKSNPGRFTRTFLAGLKGKDFAIILSQMDLDPLTGYCESSGFRSVLFLGSAGSPGRTGVTWSSLYLAQGGRCRN